MTSFIFNVLNSLKDKGYDLSSLTFILPSKRAGVFLKQELASLLKKTSFSPEILSIEEFVQELSELKKESNSDLLFHLYTAYLSITGEKDIEPFESFIKWGQILLQDFNEIDRYLVSQDKLFSYLNAIQELNHWSKIEDQTQMVGNYLKFWNTLPMLYSAYRELLIDKNIGYQGLIYRESIENLENYIQNSFRKKHIFLGFNALNRAEETIIQELLENNLAKIFWDIDIAFMDNPIHDAGLFLRHYKSKWPFYKNNPFQWVDNHYSGQKTVFTYGIPKNTGQTKHIGSLLKSMMKQNQSLQNTVVVLADESLLIPVLNSIPEEIKDINITMGFPLNKTPLFTLFESLLKLHSKVSNKFYYKDVINLLSYSFIRQLYFKDSDQAGRIIKTIENENLVYLSFEKLNDLSTDNFKNITEILFSNWENNPGKAIENCRRLVFMIKEVLSKEKKTHLIDLEHLYSFHGIFNELESLNETYKYINDIKTLLVFLKELVSNETIDFQGEPLQGLQIMGVLETRVLDFKNIILASVNEGFLPSGKSNNSFIPHDVKIEYGLPTYKEKDAIYAYHFYHLLQRSENIHLLYNTEVNSLNGGEKSRFIYQLEVEGIHGINQNLVLPKIPTPYRELKTVKKTEALMEQLRNLAVKGLSPSSLTTYIRDPIDFYYQKILGIKEYEEVEETIANNTLGTIVHNTLEEFYKPLVKSILAIQDIEDLMPKIDKTVERHFKNEYKSGNTHQGKNLIIFEVAKRYVYNFLKKELQEIKDGHSIEILGIEQSAEGNLDIPGLGFPIKINGKVDRIDRFDDTIRIIDYKTGKVEPNHVQLVNWEDITTDYTRYSKSFQVLMYAFMLFNDGKIKLPVEAGIVSFKNLSKGFMPFSKKDKEGTGAKKETLIYEETLNDFQKELISLLLEIYNDTINFTEKEL